MNTPAFGASKKQEVDPMLRKLTPLLLLVPLTARAQSTSQEDRWAGDDQYSSQPWDGADARDGAYGEQAQYENPPPPPDEESGVDQYATAPAPADEYAAGPSMDDFRSGLRPYGRWMWTAGYGWVWQPRHVSSRWQPYWDGRWVWTTAGWTWVSDEPWSWATYHYGRWTVVDGVGWVWLPGRVWAPAWVAWRWGGGYAGWCPLGPRGVVYVQPRRWVFVESPHFLAPVRHHVVPIRVVTNVWTRVQPLRVVRPTPRAGPPPRIVEQHTRVPVRVVPIVEAPSRNATRPLATGAIPVWRPRTIPYARPAAPTSPSNPPPARAVDRPRVVTPGGTVVRGDPRTMPVEPRRPADASWRAQQPQPVQQQPQPVQQQPQPVQQQPQHVQQPQPVQPPQRAERPHPIQLPQLWQQPQRGQAPQPVQQHVEQSPPVQQRHVEQSPPVPQRRVEQSPPAQQPHAEQPAPPQRPARVENPGRPEQRPQVVQPARPPPPAPAPARRVEHEGPARPAAEQHGRAVEAARDRERN